MAAVGQNTDTLSQPRISADTAVINESTNRHSKPTAQSKAEAPVKPRKPRHRDRNKWDVNENENFSVVVTGFPEYTRAQDLLQVIKQFGSAKVNSLKNGVAHLTFGKKTDAQNAVQESNKIAIYGEVLTIKPLTSKDLNTEQSTVKKPLLRSQQKTVIIEPTKINLAGDFHSQLDNIMSAVRLNQEQVMALGQLYTHLQETLQALLPGCKAIPFGSIPTGLGIKTSDADCFIAVPSALRYQQHALVIKAKRLLQQYPTIFTEVFAIPGANTPIVKFFHVPTETNCDVSFKTPLGARNSELIAFLLHADRRLIPMSVLIKYWAKVHDLSGSGRLTNYALTMLVIFYLQQPPISILPSVQWLQSDCGNDDIVDYWNAGFMRDHSKLPPNTNTSSISELIGGFFQYYSTFNFNDLIVSPYLGTPVNKNIFKNVQQLPPGFDRYKENVINLLVQPLKFLTSMCVQDPFEQCHNVASPISSKLLEKIKVYIEFAANAYEAEKLNGCQNFLKKILLEKPKFQEKRQKPEYLVALYPKMLVPISNPDWKSVVREAIFTLFETIFKLKLEKIEAEESIKPSSKVDRDRLLYKIKLTKPIWSRKSFTRLYDVIKLDFIQKQSKITEEIINSVKYSLNIEIQVCIALTKTRSVTVSLKLIDGDLEQYRQFGKFYSSVMQNWTKEILKPYTIAKPLIPSSNAQVTVQSEETIKNEETVQGDEAAQSEETVQSDGAAQSKATVQSEQTVQSKETAQSEEIAQSVESVQRKDTIVSEEGIQREKTIQSAHNIEDEDSANDIEESQTQSDEYQSCDESKSPTNNGKNSDTLNINSLTAMKINSLES